MFSLVFFLSLIDGEASSEYFQYLYMKFHEKMFYVALQISKDEMKAEDAVQETFYRLAVKEEQLEWLMSFRGTEKEFYTILFLCKQNMLRIMNQASEKHEELSGFDDEDIRAYSKYCDFAVEDTVCDEFEDEICGGSDSAGRLAWAMNKLPPEYSNLLMMFYYYKFPIDRISKELGTDKKTVYVKKSRALKRLKEIYISAGQSEFELWEANN